MNTFSDFRYVLFDAGNILVNVADFLSTVAMGVHRLGLALVQIGERRPDSPPMAGE